METPGKILLIGTLLAYCVLPVAQGWATEPTLARLSFWTPPERMTEFEAAYQEKVSPILKRHGLIASSENVRAPADSIFARLFEFKTRSQFSTIRQALVGDPDWRQVRRDLGSAFGTVDRGGLMRWAFRVYMMPSGSGTSIPVGTGRTQKAGVGVHQGSWQTFGSPDGLPSSYSVVSSLQDKGGRLWFGTYGGGVSRYDGSYFTTFTSQDGLASNHIWSILQDRGGNLWFGAADAWDKLNDPNAGGGVTRYDGKSFTTFTTEDGLASNWVFSIAEDRQGNLWFGTRDGVSRYDGKSFTTFTTEDGLASNWVFSSSIAEDRQGNLWFGMWTGGVSRFDGEKFTTFTKADGMTHSMVWSILQDRKGYLWFGTRGGGVSRYDGEKFTTFTKADGLAHNAVCAILDDQEGHLWFGTEGGGVSRFDGQTWTTFTAEDGLAWGEVYTILQDWEGSFWFGTEMGYVSRYYGKNWTVFSTENGLAQNLVHALLQDREGYIWAATQRGVSRYDGQEWVTFTTGHGLGHNDVSSIFQDRDGHMWFGTAGGVTRYDGQTWSTFTTKDGLAHDNVHLILQDREGAFWFGTGRVGISRYDGQTWTNFTEENGLADNVVQAMMLDQEGYLWFGTRRGLSRYDGHVFTNFTTKDGLVGDNVISMLQDRKGRLWFGTNAGVSLYDGAQFTDFALGGALVDYVHSIVEDKRGHLWFGLRRGIVRHDGFITQDLRKHDGLADNWINTIVEGHNGTFWIATGKGLIRYVSRYTSSPIQLTDVIADRIYGPIKDLSLSTSQKFIIFEFQGVSFKTRPGQMAYVYRLKGYDEQWGQTRQGRIEYTDLPIGEYIFEVKAVDRDLTYSQEPATVRVTIRPPYERIALIGGMGIAIIGIVIATVSSVKRRRERDRAREALLAEAEEELQTAHDMQMGLMPKGSPDVKGLDIAGRCIPANHVGGDFFQYFCQDDKIAIAMADVTGHAMDAAVPVMMFSGVLDRQMELKESIQDVFRNMNRSLHRILDRRTFVCFTMGEIAPTSHSFRLCNGGCPPSYHFHAQTGEITELEIEAYPLGVRPDTQYEALETQLHSGDCIVFCSDGIIEADNIEGVQFGFERTTETIREACKEGLSAEATIDRILEAVATFKSNAPQSDDMTCVVLRVE